MSMWSVRVMGVMSMWAMGVMRVRVPRSTVVAVGAKGAISPPGAGATVIATAVVWKATRVIAAGWSRPVRAVVTLTILSHRAAQLQEKQHGSKTRCLQFTTLFVGELA